jgi:hypothetical protein
MGNRRLLPIPRHLGRTASWVIQGEHHVVETTETQTLDRTPKPGFRGETPAGAINMEHGGRSDRQCCSSVGAIDGNLFEMVAKDRT